MSVILAALLAVLASGVIIDRLTLPTLRLLEGYWPRSFAALESRLVERTKTRAAEEEATRQQLIEMALTDPGSFTADQRASFARLDHRRRNRPGDPALYLPTRIGNILRAAETRPKDKYGLDAVVVWPRLWLLLPDSTRAELQAARRALDRAVAAVLWGALFCAFTPWTPLVVPVGLVFAAAAIRFWVPDRAETFGELVEGAYDLHRWALYKALRWPLPTDPGHEHSQGQVLTNYLWSGSHDPEPTFTPPS